MNVSAIEAIIDGACYWKARLETSPVGSHSLCIPNKTLFKLALEGPQSNVLLSGMCEDGYFVLTDSPHARRRFDTANKLVKEIRNPEATNAFLYMSFLVGAKWILADDFRLSPQFRLDRTEELALDISLDRLKNTPAARQQFNDVAKMNRAAAKLVKKDSSIADEARRRIQFQDGNHLD
jgi:hypothetical protein